MKNHQRHTYPEDFETKIGFDGVRRVLSALCQSQTGKRHVDAMCFSVRRDHIKTLLCQTAEMAEILRADADIPSDTIYDISPSLMEAKVEGSFDCNGILPSSPNFEFIGGSQKILLRQSFR